MVHCFYINLNRRLDRRHQIEDELHRMGISAERFPAIAHSAPGLGCVLSHLAVLKLARARGYPSVIIFEDDFEFLVTTSEYAEILSKVPEDFDVVMLGRYLIEVAPYNETFGKVLKATTASGYMVHQRFYDRLIENLGEAAGLFHRCLVEQVRPADYMNDQYWCRLQPSATWLYTLKRVGKQRPSYSDLVGDRVAYNY